MNKKVVEHVLRVDEMVELNLPANSVALSVMSRLNGVVLNTLEPVESDKDETKYFEIFRTGQTIPYDMGVTREYIGTCQLNNGDVVVHVFERL